MYVDSLCVLNSKELCTRVRINDCVKHNGKKTLEYSIALNFE